MSTEALSAAGWDGPEPIGNTSWGRFRWAPTWVAPWTEGERARFVQWLRDNPAAVIETDQGDKPATWLLWFFDDGETAEAYDLEDARAALNGAGWNV